MFNLRLGVFKASGHFLPGEIAYNDEKRELLLCVTTDTNSPRAFRRLFSQEKGGAWKACFGKLVRFGFNKEFSTVHLDAEGSYANSE